MRLRLAMVAVLFAAFVPALGFDAPARANSTSSSLTGNSGSCVHAEGAASEAHSAAIVITFGDGTATLRFCVKFTEDSISGLELLKRTQHAPPPSPDITVITDTSGNAVCAILIASPPGGEGSSDPTHCFNICNCPFWAYFQRKNDIWQFSPVGAASRTIHDGDTDGWSWGSGIKTPPDSPGTICPLPSPTTTATPIPPTATTIPMPATAVAGATQRPATPSAAPTSAAEPPATIAAQSTTVEDAPTAPSSAPDASAPATRVVIVAGAAVTPAASAGANASTTASSVASTSTPKSGVSIVEPDAGLRNASAAQQRHGGGFDIVPIAGFAFVVSALAAVGGFVWCRRRQFDA